MRFIEAPAEGSKRCLAGKNHPRLALTKIKGFSLIEVMIALAILAFCVFAILGMLPVGLVADRDSREETQALAILRAMIEDRRTSPSAANSVLYGIPPLSAHSIATIFVKEDGTTSPTAAGARYKIIVTPETVYTPATAPAPVYLLFHASWPANAPFSNSWVEIVAALNTS